MGRFTVDGRKPDKVVPRSLDRKEEIMIFKTRRKATRSFGALRGIIETLESRRLLTALTVTTASDAVSHSGQSLRDAILIANLDAQVGQSDTITFAANLKGQTITLAQGSIELGLGGAGSGVIAITGGGNPITISGNHASRVFLVDAGVHATFTGLTITAGGAAASITNGAGLFSQGTTTISNCTFFGNSSTLTSGTGGGAIENFNATMTINNSTFFGNSSSQGGAIYNHGVLTINDSTLSGNSAGFGGAINNFMTNSLTLQSCIVAGNHASTQSPDFDGNLQATSTYNLIGDGGISTGIFNGSAGNMVGNKSLPINPKLAPLTYYGGTTPTMALLPGSPAINAGGPKAKINFPKDQNGRSRVGAADIGAYEATSAVNFGSQVVTTTSDTLLHSGVSLRDAVGRTEVDASNGHSDTITFAASLIGKTITLAQGQLELGGVGSGVTTINGGKQITLSAAPITKSNKADRVFLVDAGVHAGFTGLTITDPAGGDGSNGGGIFSYGTTTISNCTFTKNSCTLFAGTGGGAVENFNGTMTISNSTFSGNSASQGGAIYNHGVLTITGSTFSKNQADYGGAIYNFSTLTVSGSTFSGNSATTLGGGINNTGMLTISGSTFSTNITINNGASGGGINNTGTLRISGSTFSANNVNNGNGNGGGINNTGTLTINGSTFSNNIASDGGGAIYSAGALAVTGSTFSSNSGIGTGGGGIYNSGRAAVSNSTFFKNSGDNGGGVHNALNGRMVVSNATFSGNNSFNDGGGFENDMGGLLTLLNTIVAGNTASSGTGPDVDGAVQSTSTFNLIGNGSNMPGIIGGSGGNLIGNRPHPVIAGLLPLGSNGGPTQTMALTSGSKARDAGGRLTSLTAAITSKTASRIFVGLPSFIAPTSDSTPSGFIIKIDNEQMLIEFVGNDNTSLVVFRGQNGTAAATHAVGAKVFLTTDQRGHTRTGVPDIGAYEF
jgi:predicted outer membrane repeat protein